MNLAHCKGWFEEESHVSNQLTVFASLKSSLDSRLMKRSGFVQLRVAHCRALACYRFHKEPLYQHFLAEAGEQSLKLLGEYSSKSEMDKFGRAFMYNYMYACWAAGINSGHETIDKWTGKATNRTDAERRSSDRPLASECSLQDVCPRFDESNWNQASSSAMDQFLI